MEVELLKEILKARVYDVAKHSPLEAAPGLSQEWKNEIRIKREDLQPIFSFKIRGAYNKIAQLPQTERDRGVICASAGNHGQGVALAARAMGIPAWVVMPTTTPEIKVKAVERFGAKIILAGDHYSQAWDRCQTLAAELGATMVHPFDDILVMAGQGTLGKELVEDWPDMDYVFIPVGGGGLLAGVAAYIKSLYPRVKIIGVEPFDSDAMTRSFEEGQRVSLDTVGVFADGVAVREVGVNTFRVVQHSVDAFVRVTTDEIRSAIHDIYRETRTIVEPAGALSWAGAKAYIQQHALRGKRIVTINSGANMNFQRLQFAAGRALTGAGLESLFAIRLHERKGALKDFCTRVIRGQNITEFNYRSNGTNQAYILVGIGTQDREDVPQLYQILSEQDYWFQDMTDNELAKEHIRHMIGGLTPQSFHEELYSFAFPERPGALSNFLAVMSERWNITLFHYRSQGSDFGRVLIAFEVQGYEHHDFEDSLRQVGYSFVRETENPAFKLFLQAPEKFGLRKVPEGLDTTAPLQ
jgi:threonine dehydratase